MNRNMVELALLVFFGVCLTCMFAYFEVFEEFYEFTRAHEGWELDEIVAIIPALTIVLGIFSIDRVKHLRREMRARSQLEENLLKELTTNRLTNLPIEQVFLQRTETALISAGVLAEGFIAAVRTNARRANKADTSDASHNEVFREIIERCQSAAPEGMILASMDSDTFLIFLPKECSVAQAFLHRLLALLAVPVRCGNGQISLSVRIGVAPIGAFSGHAKARSVSAAVRQSLFAAVRALESIPTTLQNGIAFYDSSSEALEDNQKILAKRVQAVLSQKAFGCAYQPIINLTDGATTGFEALARWPADEGDPIGPDVFVPIIESLGLIDQFTDQIFDTALQAAAQWPAHIGLNLNVSRTQMQDTKLAARIVQKLKLAGIAPYRITIEITETTELHDIATSCVSIELLHHAGLCIAVDDFGAGFANLNFLHDISFDIIKIDRKIISGIATNPKDQAIVRAMVAMTSSLNAGLTAEGVETQLDADWLRKLGVSHAQGYLFARPMTAKQAAQWVKRTAKTAPRPRAPSRLELSQPANMLA